MQRIRTAADNGAGIDIVSRATNDFFLCSRHAGGQDAVMTSSRWPRHAPLLGWHGVRTGCDDAAWRHRRRADARPTERGSRALDHHRMEALWLLSMHRFTTLTPYHNNLLRQVPRFWSVNVFEWHTILKQNLSVKIHEIKKKMHDCCTSKEPPSLVSPLTKKKKTSVCITKFKRYNVHVYKIIFTCLQCIFHRNYNKRRNRQ